MKTVEFGALFRFIRNGMNVKQDKSGDGLPITRIETISDATVDGTRVGFAGLQEADCRDWFLETGDILFSHINSVEHVGKCAVYRGKPEKLVHGMNLLCLRSDTAKLLPEFASLPALLVVTGAIQLPRNLEPKNGSGCLFLALYFSSRYDYCIRGNK